MSDVGDVREVGEIRRTEIDGVPAFWAPCDGPFTAALVFRVGKSDETLVSSGITHLVEHLSLFELDDQPYAYNGFVDHWRTALYASGTPDEVTGFFSTACASLSRLPLYRLANERRVLVAEGGRSSPGIVDHHLSVRFGPHGPGLLGYPELGLERVDEDEIAAWAATYFNRGNAAFWCSGEPPAGLSLALPDGARGEQPSVPATVEALPAWFHGPDGMVAVTMTGPRSGSLSVAMRVLERRGRARLRREHAVTYDMSTGYVPLAPDVAHVVAVADALPGNDAQVRDEMIALIEDLATGGPTLEELEQERIAVRRSWTDSNSMRAHLDGAAMDELGGRNGRLQEWLDELDAVTPDDIARCMAGASRTLLLSGPPDFEHRTIGPMQESSTKSVTGRTFRQLMDPGAPKERGATLVVGANGVMWKDPSGVTSTVLFSSCAALLKWESGARLLYGDDGFRVLVAPWEWAKGDEAVAAIDAAVPADRHVVPQVSGDRGPQRPEIPSRSFSLGRPVRIALLGLWVLLATVFFGALFEEHTLTDDMLEGFPTHVSELECGASSFSSAFGGASPELPPDVPGGLHATAEQRCASESRVFVAIAAVLVVPLAWYAGRRLWRRLRR